MPPSKMLLLCTVQSSDQYARKSALAPCQRWSDSMVTGRGKSASIRLIVVTERVFEARSSAKRMRESKRHGRRARRWPRPLSRLCPTTRVPSSPRSLVAATAAVHAAHASRRRGGRRRRACLLTCCATIAASVGASMPISMCVRCARRRCRRRRRRRERSARAHR